ncbi:MAG: DUF1833 domain-containing protein [Alcaligenaceae bacterium]|nr:DUF1833 domain-containing protein [Alcaligenaceae bacterium SAGV5]MPS55191.1 DUF1833 domain-containing protein [Alcaligenaceae bacterium SAGV3]MPT57882.1 DUF1833 domain-containing protein [Alcaligenaceae bacterium]
MPDYVGFFLDSSRAVIEIPTLEISHPAFSQVFYLVRRPRALVARLETGEEVTFTALGMRLRRGAARADLAYSLGVDLGDLGEIIPAEVDRARAADQMGVRPVVVYRSYRSDDLSAPMFGPIRLELAQISRTREGSSFDASAPQLNLNRTGEVYSPDRFPMLRGFL